MVIKKGLEKVSVSVSPMAVEHWRIKHTQSYRNVSSQLCVCVLSCTYAHVCGNLAWNTWLLSQSTSDLAPSAAVMPFQAPHAAERRRVCLQGGANHKPTQTVFEEEQQTERERETEFKKQGEMFLHHLIQDYESLTIMIGAAVLLVTVSTCLQPSLSLKDF